MSIAKHDQQVSVLLDDMRGRGFTDDDVRRVELALTASRVEHITLDPELEPNAEYARLLPPEELERLVATNPREMYEPGWRATFTIRGRASRPIAPRATLFLQERRAALGSQWLVPERPFTFEVDAVPRFFVYTFEHLDVRVFERHPAEVLDLRSDQLDALIRAVEQLLQEHGWEGDGDLALLWVPPFLMEEPDTFGTPVWHVKQANNGTSWLAASTPLPFPALRASARRRSR